MLNLVLFGPPGSGKGTQAQKLKTKFQLLHISTGDIFRREIKSQTKLGREVVSYLDSGKLVPDELTFRVLVKEIESDFTSPLRGIVFDGFPRTIRQASIMDDYFEKRKQPVTAVFSLIAGEEEVVSRLLLRGKTSGRSDDNDESIIRSRMQVYRDQTLPLAEYYSAQNKYIEIDGEGDIEEVFQRLCQATETLLQKENPT